ncbi:MAG: hypothetical protein AAF921_23885 [Cyanobacteria bacterium P01_D01_bin.44]
MRLIPVGLMAAGLTATVAIASSTAQSCTPLAIVGTSETEVTKTITPPGTLFSNTNWNTDFVVSDGSYRYFVVNFLPQSGTLYDIDVHLKYPDESIDTAYSVREALFTEGEAVTINAESRVSSGPYQVNLRVGGLSSEGNTYTASIVGCR